MSDLSRIGNVHLMVQIQQFDGVKINSNERFERNGEKDAVRMNIEGNKVIGEFFVEFFLTKGKNVDCLLTQ